MPASRIDWEKEGGLVCPLNFDPCFPGPYIIMEEVSNRLIITTEPGPGCIFTTLFFWALPCFMTEMRADRFEFYVTDDGYINCNVRTKTAITESQSRLLYDVTEVRFHEVQRREYSDNAAVMPYTPCAVLICHSEGQYRALEGAGKFDEVVNGMNAAVNDFVATHRRPNPNPNSSNSRPTVAHSAYHNEVMTVAEAVAVPEDLSANVIVLPTRADEEKLDYHI